MILKIDTRLSKYASNAIVLSEIGQINLSLLVETQNVSVFLTLTFFKRKYTTISSFYGGNTWQDNMAIKNWASR